MKGRPTAPFDSRWKRNAGTPFWNIFVFSLACALFAAVLSPRFYGSSFSSVLLALLVLSLGVAMGMIGLSLSRSRREQYDTATALEVAERTYKSIFDNALDGILIFDNSGTCLEANPAALSLLGNKSDALAGTPIGRLFGTGQNFGIMLKRFRNCTAAYAESSIVGADGRARFVEYTVRLNFLPGRHVAVFRDITRKKEAEIALRDSEERFQQMADNIQEIVWMIDVRQGRVLYLSRAFETITGRACRSVIEDPTSFQEAVHPEDRVRLLSRLKDSVQGRYLEDEFRIIRPDHTTRWVWARTFPVTDPSGTVQRVVGTVQDITARKDAEAQIARNYDLVVAARAEAEAFRETGLALTRNLSMDCVLDTLLRAVLKLIPCSSAQVFLVETDSRLFLAREVGDRDWGRDGYCLEAFDARDSRFLMHVLATGDSLLVSDTTEEPDWERFTGFSHLRSWLCVPLTASEQLLGVLSLGDRKSHVFTGDHLRLARSLAIPAAVAIQNARLYQQAEILRLELEQRLLDLDRAEQALGHARGTSLS